MNLRILSAASRDLLRGERFYAVQGDGLGEYFLDSLSSDINSPLIYAGTHRKIHGIIAPWGRFVSEPDAPATE